LLRERVRSVILVRDLRARCAALCTADVVVKKDITPALVG
jgi:hypothetical protein